MSFSPTILMHLFHIYIFQMVWQAYSNSSKWISCVLKWSAKNKWEENIKKEWKISSSEETSRLSCVWLVWYSKASEIETYSKFLDRPRFKSTLLTLAFIHPIFRSFTDFQRCTWNHPPRGFPRRLPDTNFQSHGSSPDLHIAI